MQEMANKIDKIAADVHNISTQMAVMSERLADYKEVKNRLRGLEEFRVRLISYAAGLGAAAGGGVSYFVKILGFGN